MTIGKTLLLAMTLCGAILSSVFAGDENTIPPVNARVEQPSSVITLPFTAPADGFYTVVIVDKAIGQGGNFFQSMAVDSRGWVFTLLHAGTKNRAPKNATFSLSAFDPQGKLRWSIPNSKDYRDPNAISGEGFMGPVNAGGELGEILGVTQWHGLHVPIVTTDGLLVAKLLRDPALGGEPGPDVYKGETIQPLNGLDDARLILAHGKNAHHFMQWRNKSETFEVLASKLSFDPGGSDALVGTEFFGMPECPHAESRSFDLGRWHAVQQVCRREPVNTVSILNEKTNWR